MTTTITAKDAYAMLGDALMKYSGMKNDRWDEPTLAQKAMANAYSIYNKMKSNGIRMFDSSYEVMSVFRMLYSHAYDEITEENYPNSEFNFHDMCTYGYDHDGTMNPEKMDSLFSEVLPLGWDSVDREWVGAINDLLMTLNV